MAACLTLEGLTKHRSGRDRSFALTVERLTLRAGDRLLLAGPNGCGKSTLLELIGLALMPDGAARFELTGDETPAVDLFGLWRRGRRDELARLRARHMGYLPQTGALLPFLSVRQNIELVQQLSGRSDPDLLREISRRLDLDGLAAEAPAQLSVGQRQRVAIARAVVHQPSFVLADEPTAALDPANARTVVQLLLDLVREIGCGLLLVSHEPEISARLGLEQLRLEWASADQSLAEPGGAGGRRCRGRIMLIGVRLGLADLRHERLMALCQGLALAAVLAPLLILYGLKHGIVSGTLQALREQPANREILVVGNYRLTPADLRALQALPEVGFLVPKPRSFAQTLYLERISGEPKGLFEADLLPSAGGDPLCPKACPR